MKRLIALMASGLLLLASVLVVLATGPYPTLDAAATARVGNANATSTAAYLAADSQTATASAPTNTPVPPTSTPTAGGIWHPAVVTSWDYTLSTGPNLSLQVGMQDFDGADNSAATVASVHANGAKAVCYFSAGSAENWRSDYGQFTTADKGKGLQGWPGEFWLDVRSANVRAIMVARIQMCAQKGFDAIDPDNVDTYTQSSGFPLTAADQIDYNTFLAAQAHAHGMAAFLKNDTDQVAQLASIFDGGVVEQCQEYKECGSYSPFVNAGKPIFEVEYKDSCPSSSLRFNAIKKHLSLGTYRVAC